MDKILGRHLENDRDTKRVTDRERERESERRYGGQRQKWKYYVCDDMFQIINLETEQQKKCASLWTHRTSHRANRQFRIRQAQTAN